MERKTNCEGDDCAGKTDVKLYRLFQNYLIGNNIVQYLSTWELLRLYECLLDTEVERSYIYEALSRLKNEPEFKVYFDWHPVDVGLLRECSDIVPWNSISYNYEFDEEDLCEFSEYIRWDLLHYPTDLSVDFVARYMNKINWTVFSRYCQLDELFLSSFIEHIDWDELSSFNNNVNNTFLQKYQDRIDWSLFIRYRHLSTELIENLELRLDWLSISKTISEYDYEFIRQHKHHLLWNIVTVSMRLEDEFLYEMRDFVNWSLVSKYYPMTPSLMRRFSTYLDIDTVCSFQTLTEDVIREFVDILNWKAISRYQPMSFDFMLTVMSKISYKNLKLNKLYTHYERMGIAKYGMEFPCLIQDRLFRRTMEVETYCPHAFKKTDK